MDLALEEARLAPSHGDVPVGAVVIGPAGQILGRGHNRREVDHDPTAHAEILALSAAARTLGQWRLEGAVVYATLEPCPMCAGALVNARIERLVFGAHDKKAGAVQSLFVLGQDPRLNHRFSVTSGVREAAATQELSRFFAKLRAKREI
jgi:tRNA(adenine34) deaminase